MSRSGQNRHLDQEMREWHARKRNTVFPDAIRNARRVDYFLWHGARCPTIVQRAGALLWGFAFFMLGVSFVSLAVRQESAGILLIIPIVLFIYIGGRIFWNGCR